MKSAKNLILKMGNLFDNDKMKIICLLLFAAINILTDHGWSLTAVNEIREVLAEPTRVQVIAIKGQKVLVQELSSEKQQNSEKQNNVEQEKNSTVRSESSKISFQFATKQIWKSEDSRVQIEILDFKSNKALARILSGIPQIGMKLTQGRETQAQSKTQLLVNPASRSDSRWQKIWTSVKALSWGVTGSYLQTDMTVMASQNLLLKLTGPSQAIYLVGSHHLRKDLQWSGNFGFESIHAQGTSPTSICAGQTSCSVDISYLGLGLEAKSHLLGSNKWPLWVGGGIYHMVALSKSSNVLDTAAITGNQSLRFSMGTIMFVSGTKEIPVDIIWNSFLTSQSVKAQQWILRAGYYW